MRITETRAYSRPAAVGKRPQAPGFSALVGANSASAAQGSFPVSPLASLAALYQDDDSEQQRAPLDHARHLLEELERFHDALILGNLTESQLRRLTSLIGRAPKTDPVLSDLIGQIEVRIAVELAKLGLA